MNICNKKNYKSILNLLETERAIKLVKDCFERNLANALNLTRVSAPLFVLPSTGLNDELNGYERRISFGLRGVDEPVEIVQSLAKWKRNALKRYGFEVGTGLYTDMNAIRRDEKLDNLHSAYVDQWDWEKMISKEDRQEDFLKATVRTIYACFLETAEQLYLEFPMLRQELSKEIYFITTAELEAMYPYCSPKERENRICKEKKSVFLMKIGGALASGLPHDGRASDYDDWELNGDILLYNRDLNRAFELSSMGIRVDEVSLRKQLEIKNELYKLNNPYVRGVLNGTLPYTIGGGIGQSRLCMFLLRKVHIGEVQASIWEEKDTMELVRKNIFLL